MECAALRSSCRIHASCRLSSQWRCQRGRGWRRGLGLLFCRKVTDGNNVCVLALAQHVNRRMHQLLTLNSDWGVGCVRKRVLGSSSGLLEPSCPRSPLPGSR